jgi:hypothetical protein
MVTVREYGWDCLKSPGIPWWARVYLGTASAHFVDVKTSVTEIKSIINGTRDATKYSTVHRTTSSCL